MNLAAESLAPLVVNQNGVQALTSLAREDPLGVVADKLLLVLNDPDKAVQSAGVYALGQLTPSDRAHAVVDKLLRC